MNRLNLLFIILAVTALHPASSAAQKCEPIQVPMCAQHMPYNRTSMPNQFMHESQQEAALEAHQFWPLVEINCAPNGEMRFLLCSMYTPICLLGAGYTKPIRACRSVCERAKLGCEKYMQKFGFEWPQHMNCEHFPQKSGEDPSSPNVVCMDPMDQEAQRINQQKQLTLNLNLIPQPKLTVNHEVKQNIQSLLVNNQETKEIETTSEVDSKLTFQLDLARKWTLTWAIVCFVAALLTVLTFLIDKRFSQGHQVPISYMAMCYMAVSSGYLLTKVDSHESGGLLSALQFILIYYFDIAANGWWLILAVSWYLQTALKWSSESILKFKWAFHTFVWVTPTVLTLSAIFISGSIDTDPLTNVTSIGNQSSNSLRAYLIIPHSILLTVGVCFWLAGLVSLIKFTQSTHPSINEVVRGQKLFTDEMSNEDDVCSSEVNKDTAKNSTNRAKLNKLMVRIGVFVIFYTVPATTVLAAHLYE
jgi:frizzled protein 5/8